jgi:hypothetical protein
MIMKKVVFIKKKGYYFILHTPPFRIPHEHSEYRYEGTRVLGPLGSRLGPTKVQEHIFLKYGFRVSP